MKSNYRQLLKGLLAFSILIGSFLGARWVRTYLFSVALVNGDSMNPTLQNGDLVLIDKRHRDFKPGDIISFLRPGEKELYVKRLIALESAQIYLENGVIYVNGEKFQESIDSPPLQNANLYWCQFSSIFEVPPEHVFVMGDNRCSSFDSRMFGPIRAEAVQGRVIKKLFRIPLSRVGD